jgi:ring-1,2-phenylacetyl-CoA epoxidase subunit PaaD
VTQELRRLVAQVTDPEIPVLTVEDLGILRDFRVFEDHVEVDITPTYSGCPAMDTIRADVEQVLHDAGVADVRIRVVLSPAWTTDWMSDSGRSKLVEYGIAPPTGARPVRTEAPSTVFLELSVRCPRCGSLDTRETSRFGSTACKSLWTCRSCLEPFDHFKAL